MLFCFFLFILFPLLTDSSRVSVSIDLGWRFHRNLPTPPVCLDPFLQNYTGQQCSGLSFVDNVNSASECQDACCDDSSCQIWQWSNMPLPSGGCWIGVIPTSGCGPGTSWISFANTTRSSGGGPVPTWASLSYADSGSNWSIVDAPHDFIITGPNENESPYVDDPSLQGQAFIPKTVGVYRKHFALPLTWQGQHIDLYCEGMYAYAQYYINGVALGTHALGYTSYFTRIDNVTTLFFNGQENVLAVFVDATSSRDTGWWYEPGGNFRHSWLIASSSSAHIVPHGLHADITINGQFHLPTNPTDGVTADGVTALAFVQIETDSNEDTNIIATFTLYASDGVTIAATASSPTVTIPANSRATTNALLKIPDGAQAWSIGRPYLHTLSVSLALASTPTVSLDSTNVTVGIRGIRWDSDFGSFVNEQRVRLRAFCDHESFTAVGGAIPARLQLFRFQAQRGMGGNGRRFSHNPPAPDLLDITDRLGVLTLDENRVFSIGLDSNMADLVSRDRNHPSVMFWSFCNEPGCNNNDKTAPTEPTQSFKYQVEIFDGTRAVTGNMCVGWGSCPELSSYISETGLNMSLQLDVQGFSHVSASTFEAYHARWPNKPLVASECCSCETMRGEADDLPMNTSIVFYSEFNAPCQASQTQDALGLEYVSGSFVWTAFDYYGEPDKWPHISSSFGSFDLAGFAKAPVFWFRSWWLSNITMNSPDRPPIPSSSLVIHIVETWKANPADTTKPRIIHVYSNAPLVSLSLNGIAVSGSPQTIPLLGFATFTVPFSPGSLLATALASDGTTVLGTSLPRNSWGNATSVRLTVDVPSPLSGTGNKLYLDGQDSALIRATIFDKDGNVCEDANNRLTFSISSGPGYIVGTGNGDPNSHEPNHSPGRAAYHGLVRAVIKVTQASAVAFVSGDGGTDAVALLKEINVDAGSGSRSSTIIVGGSTTDIVVTVTSDEGLIGDSVTISTSNLFEDSVLQVAIANVQAGYVQPL